MTKPGVYFIVDLNIADGKLAEFQAIADEMVARTQAEPGALGYEFYLDPDQQQCRLIEIYSNSDAALAHCKGRVVQQLVPKLLGVSSLAGFSVYGDLTPEAADILTQAGAQLFKTWAGFNRFYN
jgi:quinol monooxygenase YgiN